MLSSVRTASCGLRPGKLGRSRLRPYNIAVVRTLPIADAMEDGRGGCALLYHGLR